MWCPYYVFLFCGNSLYKNWTIFNSRGLNISYLFNNSIRHWNIFSNNENNVKSALGNYALLLVNFFLSIIFKNQSVMSDSENLKSHLITMFSLSFILCLLIYY